MFFLVRVLDFGGRGKLRAFRFRKTNCQRQLYVSVRFSFPKCMFITVLISNEGKSPFLAGYSEFNLIYLICKNLIQGLNYIKNL